MKKEKHLVIMDNKDSEVEEMNWFAFETKMRAIVHELVQPLVAESVEMAETK